MEVIAVAATEAVAIGAEAIIQKVRLLKVLIVNITLQQLIPPDLYLESSEIARVVSREVQKPKNNL